jgi:type II secretory pathway predicted ATPase ExeA
MAQSDRYPHLPADVRPIAALCDEDRIAHIRAERWIQHAAAGRVLGYLQEAFDQPVRRRRENVLLLGESGMGKSMLLEKFERANAVAFDEASGAQRRPVLMVLMPPNPTEAEFIECVLEALDAPSAGHWMQGSRLRASTLRLLRELGVKVLVIDEINSVLAGTPRQQRLFLQLLRFLSNELGVALVCAGVPEARHALLSDPQLRSRFSDVELPPWAPGDELRDFVNRLIWSLPLREPSPVDSAKLRALLVERSDGVTLGICKAVERAAVAAIRGGRERIDLASFEDPEVWRGVAATSRDGRPRARGAGRGRHAA